MMRLCPRRAPRSLDAPPRISHPKKSTYSLGAGLRFSRCQSKGGLHLGHYPGHQVHIHRRLPADSRCNWLFPPPGRRSLLTICCFPIVLTLSKPARFLLESVKLLSESAIRGTGGMPRKVPLVPPPHLVLCLPIRSLRAEPPLTTAGRCTGGTRACGRPHRRLPNS